MKSCFVWCLLLVAAYSFSCSSAQYIPYEKSCPAYEVYIDCGSPCQTECATLGEKCNIQNIRCPDGCYCVDGYARNEHGKCIPISECFEGGYRG